MLFDQTTAHLININGGQSSVAHPTRDDETLSEIRLALNQSQPLGNGRFHAKIERMTGELTSLKVRLSRTYLVIKPWGTTV